MTTEDIRLEGRAGRLGATMTAVVVDGPNGKEYRLPTEAELRVADVPGGELEALYAQIPFGLPDEPISPDRPSPNTLGVALILIRHAARFRGNATTLSGTATS